ncbi:DUF2147 domain-containing protein [Borrelia sp. RT5S]|uniref:DUF2147 domain-containing protein n=1 Tax=Borrelia sp. RT5S TaxID=2898581 RepID=UPI001E56CE4F|nr:DUF2147 domain-containing protein [Borrelia sp. RT5S]UGQ16426.1 DUF2147 domain-containing protein [Borrelia sp. RT5S]
MIRRTLVVVFLSFLPSFVFSETVDAGNAQDGSEVLGYWVGYDDATNVKNSVVYVYKYRDRVYGRILNVIREGKVYDVDNPSGSRVVGFDQLGIEGLDFMWGLKYFPDYGKWDQGKIIDPKNGKIYTSEMKVDSETGNLVTKGKVWVFGRTKVWTRARKDEIPRLDVNGLVPNPPVGEE